MQNLGDRNNTSFPKELAELLNKLEQAKDDPLQYHQRLAHDYVLKYKHIRGILAYQEMGSGKSILASSLCEDIAEAMPGIKIIFIASKSIHNNFRENICKYLTLRAEKQGAPAPTDKECAMHIEKLYQFVSLNAGNMLKQVHNVQKHEDVDVSELFDETEEPESAPLALGQLDNSFVVIDEAHNFFNSIVHGSKNAIGLYRLIMNADGIKLLFMTGSPIINDPFEIAVCYNMLAGPIKSGKNTPQTLFGEDYSDFVRYFIHNANSMEPDGKDIPTIRNADKLANRIVGLTSYYSTKRGDIRHLFPKLLELQVVRVAMSPKQYIAYSAARDRELEEAKRSAFRKKKSVALQKPQGATSSYRVRSRQISNFLWVGEKDFANLPVDHLTEKGLEIYSPKILEILRTIAAHAPQGVLNAFRKKSAEASERARGRGPGLGYSQFLAAGIEILGAALEAHGFARILAVDDLHSLRDHKSGIYCVISGEVDVDIRNELVKIFSSKANIRGELIALLLFTATGAEGLNTKYVRYVFAIEPYWHWARLEQVYARGVRLNSHADLPEEDRTVQPYLFLSDYPQSVGDAHDESRMADEASLQKMRKLEETTDISLYETALKNRNLNEQFLHIMQDTSIDCAIWASRGDATLRKLNCHICKPTNRPLFIADLNKDMQSLSPCEKLEEKKIKAKSIKLREKEYMYHVTDNGEIHIFEFNPKLNGYEEIYIEHPDYLEIYNLLA